MARKVIFKDDGINNLPDAPAGYKFIGYDGQVVSQKSGATVSAISGGLVSNFATEDLTFTANRTHDLDGFSLTFVNGASTLFNINQATGDVRFYKDVLGETFRSIYFITPRITIGSAIEYVSRGEFGFAHTAHDFKTDTLITTAGSFLMKVSNGGNLKMSIDKDGSFKTVSPSASALDTAFSVRNNTDTADMFKVLGNGNVRINNFGQTTTQIGAKSNGTDYWVLGLEDASTNLICRFGVGEIELNKITAIGGGNIAGVQLAVYGKQRSINLPTYADNASALSGGLVVDDEYKTATGERRIVV